MDAAIVIGASGGIGAAILRRLELEPAIGTVRGFSRRSDPPLDLTDEASIIACARSAGSLGTIRLVIDATGHLHDETFTPEKSWREIDPAHMARSFAVNAIGPALLMKHFLPLLPRTGRAVFATLSAKVGSIADNRLGGWYSYRASKAALNQLVRTAAVELARRAPEAACIAIHPGTVDTGLSAPFAKSGLNVQKPEAAARAIVETLLTVDAGSTGTFRNRNGEELPW